MGQQARQIAHERFCKTTISLDDVASMNTCLTSGWAVDFERKGNCFAARYLPDSVNRTACEGLGGTWDPDELPDATHVPFLIFRVHYAACRQVGDVITVILEVLCFVSFSAMADYGRARKVMLIGCTLLGVLFVMLHVFGTMPEYYAYNTLLIMSSGFFFSFANVFYNSYLPLLVKERLAVDGTGLAFCRNGQSLNVEEQRRQISGEMSSRGFTCGFVSQVGGLTVAALWLNSTGNSVYSYTGFTFASACWALSIAGAVFYFLRSRPGHPLESGWGYVGMSIHRLRSTMYSIWSELRQLLIFLVAWFVHSDGAATVASGASLFAAHDLRMPASYIMLSVLILSVMAIVGARLAIMVERRQLVPQKSVILLCIALMGVPPLWGALGRSSWAEYYVASSIFGLALGAYYSLNRSMFADCIPKGREAEFFGFYEVTNKGTAWIGPLLIVYVASSSGNFRMAFGSIIFFFVAGFAIFACFDPDAAKLERARAEGRCNEKLQLEVELTTAS